MKGVWFARDDTNVGIPLLNPLFSDLVECEELLVKSDSQFARRTFVRASFAFHEAFIYWLKDLVFKRLAMNALQCGSIEITKLMLLQDDSYRPNKQGKIELEPNRIPLLNLCALVLRTAAECAGISRNPLFSDNGWSEFQIALKVRDRITHPKSVEDLDIKDEEMASVRESHRWLFNCIVGIGNVDSGSGPEVDGPSAVVVAERLTLVFGPNP